MDNIGKGMVAGFIATVVLSVIMLITRMGVTPDLNVIMTQAQMAGILGAPVTATTGWIVHFVVGTILWGGLFGGLNHMVPGKTELSKGLFFGVFAWLVAMLVTMPMAGAGFFGLGMGLMASVITLVMHLIFGALMGASYAWLMQVSPTRRVEAV